MNTYLIIIELETANNVKIQAELYNANSMIDAIQNCEEDNKVKSILDLADRMILQVALYSGN